MNCPHTHMQYLHERKEKFTNTNIYTHQPTQRQTQTQTYTHIQTFIRYVMLKSAFAPRHDCTSRLYCLSPLVLRKCFPCAIALAGHLILMGPVTRDIVTRESVTREIVTRERLTRDCTKIEREIRFNRCNCIIFACTRSVPYTARTRIRLCMRLYVHACTQNNRHTYSSARLRTHAHTNTYSHIQRKKNTHVHGKL